MVSGRTILSKTKLDKELVLKEQKTFLFGCPSVDEKMRRLSQRYQFYGGRGALQLCAILLGVVEEMLQLTTTADQLRRSKQAKSRTGSD